MAWPATAAQKEKEHQMVAKLESQSNGVDGSVLAPLMAVLVQVICKFASSLTCILAEFSACLLVGDILSVQASHPVPPAV